MILVTGATGHVGGELVRALAAEHVKACGLSRDPDGGPMPAGVERVGGDLDRPETLREALRGVRAVFLLPGYRDMPGLVEEARRAGVERVVLLSGSSAEKPDMGNAITAYMVRSENAVRDGGVAWTIIRPSGFMSGTLQWVPQLRAGDLVRAPFSEVRVAMIDPGDIAQVALRLLTEDGHERRTYRLTGPQPLLPAERARILGDVLGRELRFEGLSNDEARAELSAAMPAPYVDAFFSFYVDGTLDESVVLPTVEELTGRPPRTFEQWASAHADAFR